MAGQKDKINFYLVYAIIATAVGSGFQHGYHTGVINVPQAVLKDWVNETNYNRTKSFLKDTKMDLLWGVTTSMMNLGGAIGGMLTGIVSRKLGPKNGLFYNNILVVVSTLLMGLSDTASSLEMMIVGRFLIGINCGLNAGLCPMYLSEIAPVSLRGAISSVYQLVITISILFAQVFGLREVLGNESKWFHLFLLPLFVGVAQSLLLVFCVESPKYLVGSKGNVEKAEEALQWLRGGADITSEIAEIQAEDKATKALPKVTLKQMCKERYLKIPLMICLMIMLAQQLSGINAVMFYSTQTFKESAGLSEKNAQIGTISIGAVNVAMTIASIFLVEIAGRKTLLLVGFGGMAVDTLLLAITLFFIKDEKKVLPWLSIALMVIYIILFAAGAGSIPWFLVTEMFNQEARPTAVSLSVPTNWIANFIVTVTFPYAERLMKSWVFIIFAVLNALFATFIVFMVPETKNKTIEEITGAYKKGAQPQPAAQPRPAPPPPAEN